MQGFVLRGDTAVEGVLVVLAPGSGAHDQVRYRGFQTDSDGSFDFKGVPAEDYLLFAVEDTEMEYANPAAVRRHLANARRVHIEAHEVTEGVEENKRQALKPGQPGRGPAAGQGARPTLSRYNRSSAMLRPDTPADLAFALAAAAASSNLTITLTGNNTKALMAGPQHSSDIQISTSALNRVLKYEPADLTISVEAGMLYRDLTTLLAENRQMIPLDPPFTETATIGGILASNTSGPRRRLYGAARDMVIGMTFATLEGKLVQTGGMVVKNVAGLDMGKLLIGSFGTLAAIATVNFKLTPMPQGSRTFVSRFRRSDAAIAAREAILKSVLQPAALDLLNTGDGFQLVAQASGNEAVLDRWTRELASAQVVDGDEEQRLWTGIRETIPTFLAANPEGAVVRVSCPLAEVGRVLEAMPPGSLARAGTGVCYGLFRDVRNAQGRGLIDFAPHTFRERNELWPAPGSDFAMMEKVKSMFDPARLLNRGRLYGRL